MRLRATPRLNKGKGVAKKLRNKGKIPIVVYGPDFEAEVYFVDELELKNVLSEASETSPVILEVERDGETKDLEVFFKNVQHDKVSDRVMHVDFYKPTTGHKMKINVPIKTVGKAIGVEHGGILELIHMEIPVETLPSVLVDEIEVDVSNLDLGDSVHIRDISFPQGMTPFLHPDEAVITVLVPRGLVAEEAASAEVEAEEEEVEPEVISKGKKEEEE